MKTLNLCSLLAATLIAPLFGAENWHTDYDAAKKLAAKDNKDLLIDFTGSDWCGWCIKLKEEVFDHDAFKKGVADKFVLVELDFPRDKSKLSKETQAQNDKLKDQFGIRGFPTIYLTDAKGRPYGKTGYQAGGPEKYVKHLDELRAKRIERDKALAGLKKAKGDERAKVLEKALALVPQASLHTFYKREFNDLAKLNPKSTLVQEVKAAAAEQKRQNEFRALFEKENFDGVLKKVGEIIAKEKPEGEARQKVLVYKLNAMMAKDDLKGALAVADEIEKASPDSRFGKGMKGFRKHVESKQKEQTAKTKEPAVKPKEAVAAGKTPANQSQTAKKETVKATKLVPAKKKAPEPKKPAANPMAKKEAPKAPAKPKAKQPQAKPASKRRVSEKHARDQELSKLSDDQLKKALDEVKRKLAKALDQHARTEKDWQKAQANLQDLRTKVEAAEQQLAKLKKAIADTEKSSARLEEQHEATHTAEEATKKTAEAIEKELARRALITRLEKEAAELQRKAEELRKRAEQLKH